METSTHRWGIRYTTDLTKDTSALQTQADNFVDFARPGELFLNESLQQIYYVDSTTKVAKGILSTPAPVQVLDYALTIEPNGLIGRIFKVTLEGSCNFLPIAIPKNGQEYIFLIYQDSIGGHQYTFDPRYIFNSDIGLLPRVAESLWVFKFVYDGELFIQI